MARDLTHCYVDESVHTDAGFVATSFVFADSSFEREVELALQRVGLSPREDELKSSARMDANPRMRLGFDVFLAVASCDGQDRGPKDGFRPTSFLLLLLALCLGCGTVRPLVPGPYAAMSAPVLREAHVHGPIVDRVRVTDSATSTTVPPRRPQRRLTAQPW